MLFRSIEHRRLEGLGRFLLNAVDDLGRRAGGGQQSEPRTRVEALPELPTIAEAGPVKGFDASSWFGLLAPAGTPADMVNRIQQETAKAFESPVFKERLLSQGAIPGGQPPADFVRFIAAETTKWAQVVKLSGAKVD